VRSLLREIEDECPVKGVVEIDECYFGGVRKGKRGRGAAGKVPVFGILKRGGRVYTKMIPDARARTIMPIVKAKIELDSVVYSDAFGTYDVLDIAGFHHQRINHRQAFVLGDGRHINGIENFCNQAKRHLRKYNGIPVTTSISSSKNMSGDSTTLPTSISCAHLNRGYGSRPAQSPRTAPNLQ